MKFYQDDEVEGCCQQQQQQQQQRWKDKQSEGRCYCKQRETELAKRKKTQKYQNTRMNDEHSEGKQYRQ